MLPFSYERHAPRIYATSFAIIRREADLRRVPRSLEPIVVRAIHASGDIQLARHLAFHPHVASAAHAALRRGAPILCDTHMVARGITPARLPAKNSVRCHLSNPDTPALATRYHTTRTAAAVMTWKDRLAGAIVVIGNAPTALFQLLEGLHAGWPRPAAIIATPVGFVGAAESKEALVNWRAAPPYFLVRGRRGGSAIAAAVVNALCLPE